jgi:arylsulfatase A-like enzyme
MPAQLGRPARSLLLALALVLGVTLLVLVPRGDGRATAAPVTQAPLAQAKPEQKKPNIVTVMLDDVDLAAIKYMPTVQKLRRKGVTFTRHTASYSLCCPSRATYLSGQYAHNHGVRGNFAPYGGYGVLNKDETLPVWLEKAGYATAHLGKYLNGYNPGADSETNGVPHGWTEWYGAVDPTTYLYNNYVLNVNGTPTFFGPGDANYQTDVLTGFALDFIDRRAASDQPFFLDVSYLASHFEVRPGTDPTEAGNLEGGVDNEPTLGVPPVPASRHKNLFPGAKVPRVPSYNEADVSDKVDFVKNQPLMTQGQIDYVDHWYRRRLQSLQSADEGIAKIVELLKQKGEWENTYLVFTSDNGYQLGEHRIWLNKVDNYEPSTRLPLVILGPKVKHGGTVKDWTSNVDIHRTILRMAHAKRPGATFPLDGISLKHYLRDPRRRIGRVLMHEAYNTFGAEPDPTWQGVRVGRWKWIEYAAGEKELYDVLGDPYELENRASDPSLAKLRTRLHRIWVRFSDCRGRQCIVTGYGDDWGSPGGAGSR